MDMSNQEYGKYVGKKSKPSPIWKNMLWAFVVGGLISTAGQGLTNLYKSFDLSETAAAIATSVTLIVVAALLTGFGVFDNIAKHAGAGTIVPITGFANAMVSPALEFKSEGFILGTGAKLFTLAGPVLAYGIGASVVYGLILAFVFQMA